MQKDKILHINVYDGDDGIKYIRYKDMEKMLERIKEVHDKIEDDLKQEIEKLTLELDNTNSTLKKYANKLIRIAHLHDHYVEYDYREFDKLLEEVLYNEN